MVTITNIGEDNAIVIIVEKPTKEEFDLIEKLKKFDANQQDWGTPTPSADGCKNIGVVVDDKDSGRQITLNEYDGCHSITDEEILECPFIDNTEKAEVQKRVDAKSSTVTRSNNSRNFSKQEQERRQKNERIDW